MHSFTPKLDETTRSAWPSTVVLVQDAQRGDAAACEALLVRSLPSLRKWLHGRVPSCVRGHMDTADLVQEAALHTFNRLAHFRPEHAGSMPAYLRRAAGNRVFDEMRRTSRRGAADPIHDDIRSHDDDPLAETLRSEERAEYRSALLKLRTKDRRLLIARHQLEWSFARIARRLRLPSEDAARMALRRAERRLLDQLACRSAGSTNGARF